MNKILLLSIICLLTVTSCGKDSGGGSGNSEVFEQQQDLNGKYRAHLRPLNTTVSGFIPYGAAEVEVLNGELSVKTYLDDDSQVLHAQNIYSGSKCPTLSSDKNGDGIIDINELQSSAGSPIIPLDSDLSSQQNGYPIYPKGSSFTYVEKAKVRDFINDLYSSNNTLVDGYIKLQSGMPFNFEKRVIIILGTSDINRVPSTVASLKDQPRNISVPIVCGILKRI